MRYGSGSLVSTRLQIQIQLHMQIQIHMQIQMGHAHLHVNRKFQENSICVLRRLRRYRDILLIYRAVLHIESVQGGTAVLSQSLGINESIRKTAAHKISLTILCI